MRKFADNLYAMKLVSDIARIFRRLLRSSPEPLDRTKLVGIYMSTTNGRDGYLPDLQDNRSRRNGKHNHHRERA